MLALQLSLPLDYGGPELVNFERAGISTYPNFTYRVNKY